MTLAQHHSLSAEHFTPAPFVEAARETMGGIDLDPASCPLAQGVVAACKWYGPGSPFGEDGLVKEWKGRVFLNPPGGICDAFGRPVYNKTKERASCRESGACGLPPGHSHDGVTSSMYFWWGRLISWYTDQKVTEAVFVAFNLEFVRGASPDPLHYPFCVPFQRVAYDKEEDGTRVKSTQPPHASMLFYLPDPDRRAERSPHRYSNFARAFQKLGTCYAATRL